MSLQLVVLHDYQSAKIQLRDAIVGQLDFGENLRIDDSEHVSKKVE